MLNYLTGSLVTTTNYTYNEADRLTYVEVPRGFGGASTRDRYYYNYDNNGSLVSETLTPANSQPATNRYTTTSNK